MSSHSGGRKNGSMSFSVQVESRFEPFQIIYRALGFNLLQKFVNSYRNNILLKVHMSHNFPHKPQSLMTAILRHFVAVAGLEVFPAQHPYPVYSIGSSVHAEIQCQLTINGNKKTRNK